jgi:hypothetical protein
MLHAVDEINPATGDYYIPKAARDFAVASNGWVVYSNPSSPNYKQPYVTPDQYSLVILILSSTCHLSMRLISAIGLL